MIGVGAAAGAASNSVRIVKNYGNLAVSDMAAKARLAELIRDETKKIFADGQLSSSEFYCLIQLTNPRIFIYGYNEGLDTLARLNEAKPPAEPLIDILTTNYKSSFSEELASFGKLNKALARELKFRVANTLLRDFDLDNNKTWERAVGVYPPSPYTSRAISYCIVKALTENSVGTHVDLHKSTLDEQVIAEFGKVQNYFLSPQRQNAFRREAEEVGNAQNKLYNGALGAGLVAAALAAGSAMHRRRQSHRSFR